MAVDMFLKLGDVKGESKDAAHKGEIDLLAWSWGVSNSGSTHTGGGGGSGKANFQDISITKYVDSASPKLLTACSKGTHYPEVTLVVRKAGDKPLEYLKIKLNEVLVTSYSTGGSGGEDRLTENVSLNFAKFAVDYIPQDDKGGGTAAISSAFDIAANKA
jgi:type VI secretion system secreted protein Hcp